MAFFLAIATLISGCWYAPGQEKKLEAATAQPAHALFLEPLDLKCGSVSTSVIPSPLNQSHDGQSGLGICYSDSSVRLGYCLGYGMHIHTADHISKTDHIYKTSNRAILTERRKYYLGYAGLFGLNDIKSPTGASVSTTKKGIQALIHGNRQRYQATQAVIWGICHLDSFQDKTMRRKVRNRFLNSGNDEYYFYDQIWDRIDNINTVPSWSTLVASSSRHSSEDSDPGQAQTKTLTLKWNATKSRYQVTVYDTNGLIGNESGNRDSYINSIKVISGQFITIPLYGTPSASVEPYDASKRIKVERSSGSNSLTFYLSGRNTPYADTTKIELKDTKIQADKQVGNCGKEFNIQGLQGTYVQNGATLPTQALGQFSQKDTEPVKARVQLLLTKDAKPYSTLNISKDAEGNLSPANCQFTATLNYAASLSAGYSSSALSGYQISAGTVKAYHCVTPKFHVHFLLA